jgi:hypothetical protein
VRLGVLAVKTGVSPELDRHHLLAGGVLYGDAVRVYEAGRTRDLTGSLILVLFVSDPLCIGDGILRLLARVTVRGAGSLGIV